MTVRTSYSGNTKSTGVFRRRWHPPAPQLPWRRAAWIWSETPPATVAPAAGHAVQVISRAAFVARDRARRAAYQPPVKQWIGGPELGLPPSSVFVHPRARLRHVNRCAALADTARAVYRPQRRTTLPPMSTATADTTPSPRTRERKNPTFTRVYATFGGR